MKAAKDQLLEVQHLSARFDGPEGPQDVVRDVSFSIGQGEVVALVGESGSGKSLSAFLPFGLGPAGSQDALVQGSAHFGGRAILPADRAAATALRGRRVGFVFQDPMAALNPWMRVGEQLAEGMPRAERDPKKLRARLEEVGIPEAARRLSAYPHELSGGLRQRVLIAIALRNNPDLLIADEPTTALDVTVEAALLDLFRKLCQERGMSLLLISHDLGVVAGIADRVVVLYAGQVVEEGATEALFRDPAHPYTQGLLCARPHPDSASEGRPLPTIGGFPPNARAWPKGCAFAPRCPHAVPTCHEQPPVYAQHAMGRSARCVLERPLPPFDAEAAQ